jgi:hypothetical protein
MTFPLDATRYRNYHPTLGRWIERDPVGYADGMGLYQYVSGNTAGSSDPSGLLEKADVSLPDVSGKANIALEPSQGDKAAVIILDGQVICAGPIEAGSIWDCPFDYEKLRAPGQGELVVKVCREDGTWEQHLARYQVAEKRFYQEASKAPWGAIENLGLHSLYMRVSGFYYSVTSDPCAGAIKWAKGAAKWADDIKIQAGATYNPEAGEGFMDIANISSPFGSQMDLRKSRTASGGGATGAPSFQRGQPEPPADSWFSRLFGGGVRDGYVLQDTYHSVRGKWFVLGGGGKLKVAAGLGIRAPGGKGKAFSRNFEFELP